MSNLHQICGLPQRLKSPNLCFESKAFKPCFLTAVLVVKFQEYQRWKKVGGNSNKLLNAEMHVLCAEFQTFYIGTRKQHSL